MIISIGEARETATRFPDLGQVKLRYFLAIISCGGMRRAADELGISQQALSKSIRKLEAGLGVSLFERTPSGLALTLYGKSLADHARSILTEFDMAATEIESLRGYKSEFVRVGVGPSLAWRRAPTAVLDLLRRVENVGVTMLIGNTDQLIPRLLDGELDFIVSAPVPETVMDAALVCENFGHEYDELVGRTDHPLRAKPDRQLRDFAAYTWIGEVTKAHVIRRASRVFVEHGISPFSNVIATNSVEALKTLLRNSDALSLLHRELYVDELESGLLKAFELPEFRMQREIRIYRRKSKRLRPVAKSLLDIFRNILTPHA